MAVSSQTYWSKLWLSRLSRSRLSRLVSVVSDFCLKDNFTAFVRLWTSLNKSVLTEFNNPASTLGHIFVSVNAYN